MKYKINNGYKTKQDYNCFGCSPHNKMGLQLEFYLNEDFVESYWEPTNNFEGYHNVIHGGIQATLMDEIANWVLLAKLKSTGVTKSMIVNYLYPAFVNEGKILVRGKFISFENNIAKIFAEILNSNNKVVANSEIEYFIFPENIAKKRYGFPGIEHFDIENEIR